MSMANRDERGQNHTQAINEETKGHLSMLNTNGEDESTHRLEMRKPMWV